jgi:hypothetical protein
MLIFQYFSSTERIIAINSSKDGFYMAKVQFYVYKV